MKDLYRIFALLSNECLCQRGSVRFSDNSDLSKGSESKAETSIQAPQSYAVIQQNRPFATDERRGSKTKIEFLSMRDAFGSLPKASFKTALLEVSFSIH